MLRGHDLLTAVWFTGNAAMVVLAIWLARRAMRERKLRNEEYIQREELEAYARLDPSFGSRDLSQKFATRVCATVAQYSSFRQVAMLLRDAEGRLNVAARTGADQMMSLAINAWVARFAREHKRWDGKNERRASYPVMVASIGPDNKLAIHNAGRQVFMLPLWSQLGDMFGALVVWTNPRDDRSPSDAPPVRLSPVEMLAQKLSHSIDVTIMTERLLKAEKMTSLPGVAHELSNPLTAVLGYAELIAETTADARVRQDAVSIAGEARRMKDTVNMLFRFKKTSPSTYPDERCAPAESASVRNMAATTAVA